MGFRCSLGNKVGMIGAFIEEGRDQCNTFLIISWHLLQDVFSGIISIYTVLYTVWRGGGGVLETIRERWPLLAVEAEMNGDSKSTNERGLSLVASLGLLCRYKRVLFCLDCSRRPSTKYFFPHRTPFKFFYPHRPSSWTGSRDGSPVA